MKDHQGSHKMFLRFVVKAERSVAVDSPDHISPWGTRRDNSRSRRFNQKLYSLFNSDINPNPFWILDMGCSGGGFVKDCLDDGCLAMGLEGSDYSKRLGRAEWRTIPEYLFTADITYPFQIQGEFDDGVFPIQFDIITSWEVIEHIAEPSLKPLAENVLKHLKPGGLWIMSITPVEHTVCGVKLHQTVKPRDWWIAKFRELGFEHREAYVRYFNTHFVRGPKYGDPESFHLILAADPAKTPPIPKESWRTRMYDLWLGSRLQRRLKCAVVGN
jgi:SAM-dependent methyltransferase